MTAIRGIGSIRDLLVVAVAPGLMAYIEDYALATGVVPTGQELVAYVLDHITPTAYALLTGEAARQVRTDTADGSEQAAPSSETGTEH
jgi:hypothetical protein